MNIVLFNPFNVHWKYCRIDIIAKYIELDISLIEGPTTLQEEVLAYLSDYGFDGFREEEHRILAYTGADQFDRQNFEQFISGNNLDERIRTIRQRDIPRENWNRTWEDQYDPVEIGSSCYVRAPFHPEKTGFDHSLIIQPKMSFGTAHHASTRLMIEQMLKIDFNRRTVLDMGCGTGILAILAEKLGGSDILAVDNYSWACENTQENIKLNDCRNIDVKLGETGQFSDLSFDQIAFNSSKNFIV